MTCCLVRLPLVLLIVAWSMIPIVAAEPEASKTPSEPTPAKSPADATPAKAADPATPKTPAEPAATKGPTEAATPKPANETPTKPVAKSTTPPPNVYTVKKSPLKITVDLEGVFLSDEVSEISVKTEEWSGLSVLEAVTHGAHVKKGDVLLKFQTDKLDQVIGDLQTDQKLSEVTLQLATDQLSTLEKLLPLDLESGERNAKIAEEDRVNYVDVERPFALKAAEFWLKDANNTLENQQEELRQLEKMYKADDITEETEQIVLKRAKDNVERAKFGVEYTQLRHDQMLKFAVPRMDTQVKEMAQRKSIDWEKTKAQLPLAIQKQRLDLEKLKVQRERAAERLKKLLADRELMVVKSPADGIVYYGKVVRGRFSDSTGMSEMFRPRGNVPANQVVMTIVDLDNLSVRASVPEAQLHNVRQGEKATVIPAGYPDTRLAAEVEEVGSIPLGPGSFDVRLSLDGDEPTDPIVPGMACKVRLTPYVVKHAITVPPKALVADELRDDRYYVYVLKSDGTNKKTRVTVGKRTEGKVEILRGLRDDDQVLLDPPKN